MNAVESAVMSESTGSRSKGRMLVLLGLHAVSAGILLWLLLRHVPQYRKALQRLQSETAGPDDHGRPSVGMVRQVLVSCNAGLACGDLAIMILLHRIGRAGLMTAWGVWPGSPRCF